MFNRRDALRHAAALPLAAALPSLSAMAQEDWPVRDIHVICPFATGSGADLVARFFAAKLRDLSGRNAVVENRVGAAGLVASQYVAKSRPDGYTVYIIPGLNVLGAAPALFKSLPFDPVNDFEHITTLAKIAQALVVSVKSPYTSVEELVADLKAKGDRGNFGAVSNTSLICGELFRHNFGLETRPVLFKDFATTLSEMNGGAVSYCYLDAGQVTGHRAGGRIRALVSTTAERNPALPDVPGAKEAGIENMDIAFWWSAHLPKGTPQPIVARYQKWFNEIVAMDETRALYRNNAMTPFPGNSQALRDLLTREIATWRGYAAMAKIEPQ